MARILWSAQFHVGCTATAMPIVLRLRDRGHQVDVLSVPAAEASFRDAGLGFVANRRFPVYDFSSDEATADGGYERWWRKLVRLQMADTLDLLAEERYDLVFGGSCMQLCGHGLAAERAGIPWVSYIDFLVDETARREPEFPQQWDRWRASLGLQPEPRAPDEALWFPFSRHLTLYLVHPDLAFGPAPPYVLRVGASMGEPQFSGQRPHWLEELGTARPAVLVSTSSLRQDDIGLVSCAAEALADDDIDVVATVAAEQQLPMVPKVIVTRQFPHTLILPRVGCVVCSAGLGTVTRALCSGIPVVVVPRSGDGYNVARAVVRSGAGVAVAPSRLSPALLGDAIRRVLGDGRLRAAATAFKGEPVSAEALDDAADRVGALLP